MNPHKILQHVLSGAKDIRFSDAVQLAEAFGFHLDRINGSPHIFKHPDILPLINLQNVRGKAKPYQVQQMLRIVERHNLHLRRGK